MACKDDRIWTKSLLFIYAKICVNVKCHLNHALFMVWLFLWGEKKKRRSMLAWRSPLIESPSHWQVSVVESSDNGASLSTRRTGCGCGHAPWLCLPALIWAGLKRHCLSFHAARNHSCASPWIEGCAICKIPKDNFIYSCCKQCLYKVY